MRGLPPESGVLYGRSGKNMLGKTGGSGGWGAVAGGRWVAGALVVWGGGGRGWVGGGGRGWVGGGSPSGGFFFETEGPN